MLRSPPTLYELCLQKTSSLLKGCYWKPELPLKQNPFSFLPTSIVNALIVHVTKLFTLEPLLSSHLRFLSASGQVTEFVIEDIEKTKEINLDQENLNKILMDLSASCRHLTTVKINFGKGQRRDYPIASPALNFLLSKAPNIKYIVSCLKFDLRVLRNSTHLKQLILTFPVKSNTQDFLGVNVPFMSIHVKHEVDWYPISYHYIAVLLKFCKELVYVDLDISKSLEYLHAKELRKGTLTTKYKLLKCRLGNEAFSRVTSRDVVEITALTCPYLQEIEIFINDEQVISALNDCKNLRTLSIMWEPFLSGHISTGFFFNYGNYTVGVRPLLEKPGIGCNLRSLELVRFSYVDFPSIGKYCPNLEVLKVLYLNKDVNFDYSNASFQKLALLCLGVLRMGSVDVDILTGILSNAANLEDLTIVLAKDFTDEVIDVILKKNSLSKLKTFCAYSCNLTIHGMRKLARSATNLKTLKLEKRDASSFQEIVRMFQEINPKVNVAPSMMSPWGV